MPHRCGHLFPLEVRQGGVHERSFVTTNRLVQNFPFKDVIYTITIEPDFEYDLASVPKYTVSSGQTSCAGSRLLSMTLFTDAKAI